MNMLFQQIKLLMLSILAIIRRALCCFSRRRKPSFSDPVESLQSINVVSHNSSINKKHVDRDWNSWDDSPRTVEEHIEQYRQRIAKPTTPQSESEPDFFSELTPVIQPQPKFFLENHENNQKTDFSRLAAVTDVPIAVNADLEDWEEEDPGGWEELDTEHTKQVIREKRRELRSQRQKSARSSGRDQLTYGKQKFNSNAASYLNST